MQTLPTVRVFNFLPNGDPDGYVSINAEDFDENVHELWSEYGRSPSAASWSGDREESEAQPEKGSEEEADSSHGLDASSSEIAPKTAQVRKTRKKRRTRRS